MGVIEKARQMRSQIEQIAATIPDDSATEYADLFPKWNGDGTAYTLGARVRYDGVLYKCLQSHTSQEDWKPTAAPSLWGKVLAGQDGTSIGEWEQPDSTNPYMKGDKVLHNGKTWESTVDNNVWEPSVYGWDEVEE